jgi:DNA-binding XRE family transcriptional regulator
MGDEKNSSGLPVPVQFRAEFQFAPGDLVQLPGAQLWNDFAPIRDRDLGNSEGSSSCHAGPEVFNNVFFEHPSMLAITNRECKDDVPSCGYAEPMETMGNRIKTLRLARGLTQEQLGERVGGVSKVTVSQWETGASQNMNLRTFLLLCDELGTTPRYLVFGPGQPGATGGSGASRRRSG